MGTRMAGVFADTPIAPPRDEARVGTALRRRRGRGGLEVTRCTHTREDNNVSQSVSAQNAPLSRKGDSTGGTCCTAGYWGAAMRRTMQPPRSALLGLVRLERHINAEPFNGQHGQQLYGMLATMGKWSMSKGCDNHMQRRYAGSHSRDRHAQASCSIPTRTRIVSTGTCVCVARVAEP
jgi:hypothetical protein